MLEQSEISSGQVVTEMRTVVTETVSVNGTNGETGYNSENSGQEEVHESPRRTYSESDILYATADDRPVKADDLYPFPIFFKRSKKDPGSKLHDALIEELSSVLQKRKITKRNSGLWEVDEESKETKYKSIREQRQQSRSVENISVFANKELLAKLESHFARNLQSQREASEPAPRTPNGQPPATPAPVYTPPGQIPPPPPPPCAPGQVPPPPPLPFGTPGQSPASLPPGGPRQTPASTSGHQTKGVSVNGIVYNGVDVSMSSSNDAYHGVTVTNKETGEQRKGYSRKSYGASERDQDNGSSSSDSHHHNSDILRNRNVRISKSKEISFGGEESDSDNGGYNYRSYTLGGRGQRPSYGHDSGQVRSQTLDRSYKHVTKINVQNGHFTGGNQILHEVEPSEIRSLDRRNVHVHNGVNIEIEKSRTLGRDRSGPTYSSFVEKDGRIERHTSFNANSKVTVVERRDRRNGGQGNVSSPMSFLIKRNDSSEHETDHTTWATTVDQRRRSQSSDNLDRSGSWTTQVDHSAKTSKQSGVHHIQSQRVEDIFHPVLETRKSSPERRLIRSTSICHKNNDTEVYISAEGSNQQKMYVVKLPTSQPLSPPIRSPVRAAHSSPGSPFTQEIGEGALATAHGDGLYRGEEDKPATFFVEAGGITGEPTIQVDGPNSIAKCSIDPQPGGRFVVTYVPVETGLFDITVKWNGRDIHGSPFHPRIVDARKVRVIGGWQHYMDSNERIHLVVGEEKHIPFETAEAGPGKLTAEVRGPSGSIVPCTVDDSYNGKSTVIFTPREEGHHNIHLNWSDHPLSGSAFSAFATGGFHDITKIILSGRGLKEATVREEAEFFIDGSQAGRGEPQVQLTGVRAEVNVITSPLGGGKYRCTYIPVIPGAYLLHITWNGRQVKGAPFKVNVIGAFYPNKVAVSGEGLKGGLLGRDLDIRIDTRKAGPGELTAFCSGPNKVAYCDLEDNRDGTFRLLVKAQEPGRHVLQVKYGGEHVLGSPFVFRVSAQPDASKVRVSGPGVEHGILATFQSRFIVETRGAGAGQLMVRIRGPKGAFQVEMYRDSQKDRTILCRFDPTETGLYIIHVKWSNVDVPGSPFQVHIVDTQLELEQVLQEQSYSSNTLPSSRSYSQWREEF